jgi:WS/DGAT/MGAT family acyltransferase
MLELAGRGAGAVGKIALMTPDSRTVLKGPLGVLKRAAWTTPVALPDVKAVGQVLGGTVNDVLITAASGGLRRYMRARGEPVDGLTMRAMMPVNLLPPGAKPAGGNNFGMVYVTLPVGVEDAVERAALVRRETAEIKRSPEAALGFGIVSAMGATPTEVEHALVETLCSRATAVLTNVPGPQRTLYLAGRAVRRTMFWVPKAGRLSLGLSIFSYDGSVHMGVAVDAGLIPDPERLAACIDAEIAELVSLERAVEV